jgi:cytidine deaminase
MNIKQQILQYEIYESAGELKDEDRTLLIQAKKAAETAYAPYSQFKVGAAALLTNGSTVMGSNQENASFPAGLCAERVLMSALSSRYPDLKATCIAISYLCHQGSDHPITPCGICRQTLLEFEQRWESPIRLVLGGLQGQVFIIASAQLLLPLAFTGKLLDLAPLKGGNPPKS